MIGDWLARAARALRPEPGPSAMVSRDILGLRVDVINSRPDIDTERVFRRAEAVLSLVSRFQPARFAHIRRDLARILVERYPTRGAFMPDTRTCLLELTFMANESFTDEQVASTLVHEGMHARLTALEVRFGIASFTTARARHERICRRAELAFGYAVPNGEAVVERALESLQLVDEEVAPSIDWQEAQRRVAAVDRAR